MNVPRLKQVLCAGIVVLDRIYALDTLPQGEAKYTASAYRESGGGIAGTAAVAVARLGGEGLYLGAVGNDAAGDWLQAELRQLGVGLEALQIIEGGRTPNACALVAPDGTRCLIVDRGTIAPQIPPHLPQADALLVDHRFPDLSAALLKAANVPSVLDAEGGEPATLRALAALADYPVFSSHGLRAYTGEDDPHLALAAIDAPKARAVAVTRGAEGSFWRIDGTIHHIPAPRIEARDTTGCGDVFHGALALALAEGEPVRAAARFATAAAALKACNGGGWRGMPAREEVEALRAGGW